MTSASSAFATDWDSPPAEEKIQPGDTVFKGDGEIKVFDKQGRKIYSGPMDKYGNKDGFSTKGQYDNGNYGGLTDIWWKYGLGYLDSGPKGEGATWGYAIPSTDFVYVKTTLETDLGGDWDVVDQDTDSDYDTDDSVTAYVSDLSYMQAEVLVVDCRAESKHIVEDDPNGWDDVFYTDDEF